MEDKRCFERIAVFTLYFYSIAMIFVMIMMSFNESIWTDEAYSLRIIKNSWLGIIRQTSSDVHPPLYYFLLKFFINIFNRAHVSTNEIVLGKLVSVLPFIILLFFSITVVRKRFGSLCSGIFIFCITSMPNMLEFSVEIRMYSWSMLFVTLAYIYFFDVINTGKRFDWIKLSIYSLLASYTHLYACVAVSFIYFYILIWGIVQNKQIVREWFIFSAITILLYVPWLIVAAVQLSKVRESFWIPEIDRGTVIDFVKYAFFPRTVFYILNNILGYALAASYVLVLYSMFREKNKSKIEYWFAISGFLVKAGTEATGIIASIILNPIFISRYIFCALGCFWFCFSYCLSRLIEKAAILSIILSLILIIGISDCKSFIHYEVSRQENYESLKKTLDELSSEDIILCSYSPVRDCLNYYTGKVCLFCENNDIYQTLKDYTSSGSRVWLFDSGKYSDVSDQVKTGEFNLTKKGAYALDLYFFDVYLITK